MRGKWSLFSGESDHPASAWMSASALANWSLQRLIANWPPGARLASCERRFLAMCRQPAVFSSGCGQYLLICHSSALVYLKSSRASSANEGYLISPTVTRRSNAFELQSALCVYNDLLFLQSMSHVIFSPLRVVVTVDKTFVLKSHL